MTPYLHIKLTALLLAGSIAFELALLVGLFRVSDALYHSLHIVLIATVVLSQLLLYRSKRGVAGQRHCALIFALGTMTTGVGDYINSALSSVEPTSRKLTWALLLFGLGYLLYCAALWRHGQAAAKPKTGRSTAALWLIAALTAVVNGVSWFLHVRPNVRASDILYHGSFAFSLTLYVALPTFAFRYFMNTKWSTGGLVVLLGALFLPYSDLVLFASWLHGDPPAPSAQLYMYNWILYFGGQVMISMFPTLVLCAATDTDVDPSKARASM